MSQAVLYHGPADYRYCSSKMVEYCKNTTECRRVSILKPFTPAHHVSVATYVCLHASVNSALEIRTH